MKKTRLVSIVLCLVIGLSIGLSINVSTQGQSFIPNLIKNIGLQWLIDQRIVIPTTQSSTSFSLPSESSNKIYVKGPIFTMVWSQNDLADGKTSNGMSLTSAEFQLDPSRTDLYYKIALSGDSKKTVVVFPTFTRSAYHEGGFYDYYNQRCDSRCLETQITDCIPTCPTGVTQIETSGASLSQNAFHVLKLLNYSFITDIDIDKNPGILKQYDKVILLHNEYVTQKEFDAITNHPLVIYLYPNALMAKIEVNYETNTIKLIRGHWFPEQIWDFRPLNGFNWKFDNTSQESDHDCKDWRFNKIDNGYQLNCTPEYIIYKDAVLLQQLKDYR